jgi:ABC-type antimicrobial peptide transport system permease subunit
LLETLMLGFFAGALALLGSLGLMHFLGTTGIPAGHKVMVFLFSGPRLYPELGLNHLLFGFGVILMVSIISTLYPARLAMKIQPVVAMQARE